ILVGVVEDDEGLFLHRRDGLRDLRVECGEAVVEVGKVLVVGLGIARVLFRKHLGDLGGDGARIVGAQPQMHVVFAVLVIVVFLRLRSVIVVVLVMGVLLVRMVVAFLALVHMR